MTKLSSGVLQISKAIGSLKSGKESIISKIISIYSYGYNVTGGYDLTWSEEFSFYLVFICIHPPVEINSGVEVMCCMLNRTNNQFERSCLSAGAVIPFPLQLKIYNQTELQPKIVWSAMLGPLPVISSVLNLDLSKVICIKERLFVFLVLQVWLSNT